MDVNESSVSYHVHKIVVMDNRNTTITPEDTTPMSECDVAHDIGQVAFTYSFVSGAIFIVFSFPSYRLFIADFESLASIHLTSQEPNLFLPL
jgi:hypothetical protein